MALPRQSSATGAMAGTPTTLKMKQSLADSSIKDFIKLDTFKTKFNARDFIEAISSKNVVQAQGNTQEFDPKPFIRNFESAVEELLRLRKKVQNKIDDLEDEAMAGENARKRKLGELGGAFDEVQTAFEQLDSRLGEVGKTAIRIGETGEQLETIDKQRTRATEAKDLIGYFIQFNSGGAKGLEALRGSGPEGKYKAAITAKRLALIAKEVDIPGTESARMNIEKFCEETERGILDQFDAAYKVGDREVMNRCAKTLLDFNGGASCVQAYVNQHEFFINRAMAEVELEGGGGEADDDNPQHLKPDPSLLSLYDDIRKTCQQEWSVIYQVFPNSASVMQQFVQRIFAQLVQTRIETTLSNAQSHYTSSLPYLRKLAACYAATAELVADLHKLDEKLVASNLGAPALTGILNRSFEDLFVPYVEGDRYIEVEQENMVERFRSCLRVFHEYAAQRAKNPPRNRAVKPPTTPLIPNAPNLPATTATAPSTTTTQTSPTSMLPQSPTAQSFNQMMTHFSTFAATMDRIGQDISVQIGLQAQTVQLTPEEMGMPSTDLMLKLLGIHVEAMKRCRELSQPGELPVLGRALCGMLIDVVGEKYLSAALEMIIEDCQYQDLRNEPDVNYLYLVQVSNKVLQLLQIHFQHTIVPIISLSPTIHRDMVSYKNDFMSGAETLLNNLLQKNIDAIVRWLSNLLAKQKKNDFRPRDDNSGLGVAVTLPCSQCCEFLAKVHSYAVKFLDGQNMEIYLTEIGTAFNGLLLDHFKKFYVTHAGGFILSKDLAKYQETITLFRIPALTECFDMLRELGNLFIVKPETLKTVVTEGHLSRIEPALLLPYLQMRIDWPSLTRVQKELFYAHGAQEQSVAGAGEGHRASTVGPAGHRGSRADLLRESDEHRFSVVSLEPAPHSSTSDAPTSTALAPAKLLTLDTASSEPLAVIAELVPSTAVSLYKRHVSDVKFEVASADEDGADNTALAHAIVAKSDLISGVYEGGLKTWECSIDLVNYLAETIHGDDVKGRKVIELGCGSALPGIYCLQQGAEVHFQDYNSDVLHLVTFPNILLNITLPPSSIQLDANNTFDATLDPASLSSIPTKLWSGDWGNLRAEFASLQEEQKFDLILTAETIYAAENHAKLFDLIRSVIKPGGIVLIAAKTNYFGCSGSLRQFEELVRTRGGGVCTVETVKVFAETVRREIVKLQF
ncbi:Exocyst complex component 5 [Rhizophlyctis rosea]|nr:Exocyst complex component 5 [Rhizophlyctis rosea]